MDISGLLPAIGVNLEAQAFNALGAAVSNQITNLSGLFNSSALGSSELGSSTGDFSLQGAQADWNPTPYAAATASGIGGYDPKQKFLFKVAFSFYPAAQQMAKSLGVDVGSALSRDLTYVVKQIDLPKYTFEYEEVNMYNFRTKVLTKVKHEELNFKFYDDVANNALKFVNTYLQILVPLSRQGWTSGYSHQDHGFAFSSSPSTPDTSMRAPIGQDGSGTGILNSMTIYQYYLDRSNPNLVGQQIRQAIKVNTYVFTNPRLTSFTIDDQDHEGSNTPNMITCGFDFDALNIVTGAIGDSVDISGSDFGYMETNDILSQSSGATSGALGLASSAGRGGDVQGAFMSDVASQGFRMPTTSLSGLLSAGGISTVAGHALGNVTSQLTAAFGSNAARTLAAIGRPASAISPPTTPFIEDDSSGGEATSQVGDSGSIDSYLDLPS